MKPIRHERREAERITPLILAIGREIDERYRALLELGRELRAADRRGPAGRADSERIRASMATEKRELRRVERELAGHGASIVGTAPLTLRVGMSERDRPRSLLLQLRSAARRGA